MAKRIAVLVNGFNSPNKSRVEDSFRAAVQAASPGSSVTTYDPIEAQVYPDVRNYDLIVLSGGTADPMGQDEWVLKLQKWLRQTVADHPSQKFMGICWGHQTICVTFGGEVQSMPKAEIGIMQLQLTDLGKDYFKTEELKMHEFHRREISKPAVGFKALATGNQSFISASNNIMTFQGHPELTETLAKAMLAETPSYMGVSDEEKVEIARNMEQPHDGLSIWRRVLGWVDE